MGALVMVVHLVYQTGVLIYATFSVVSTFFQFEEHMTAFFASLAILVQVLFFLVSIQSYVLVLVCDKNVDRENTFFFMKYFVLQTMLQTVFILDASCR